MINTDGGAQQFFPQINKFESLESRVSDLSITDRLNFSLCQDGNGFEEDRGEDQFEPVSGSVSQTITRGEAYDPELCPQTQHLSEEDGVFRDSMNQQVATKEFENQAIQELQDCTLMVSQPLWVKDNEVGNIKSLAIAESKDCEIKSYQQSTGVESNEKCSVIGQKMADTRERDANLAQFIEKKNSFIEKVYQPGPSSEERVTGTPEDVTDNKDAQQMFKNEVCDVDIQHCLENKNDGGVECHLKREKYFYYDPPLSEETGVWIPVSIPPMSESEHDEWARGFGSNGGTFPEEDMGWGDLFVEDKELTMWDVVVEMLLVARGKVNAIASADISNMSWMSGHIIEQAWKEMAQTLTEVNYDKTQEILKAKPPKWLPDSAASACMLCSVRFHPIMCTRHHCRFCGGIFCNECTKGRSLLPEDFRIGDPQRVCDVCCVRLESVQPYLMDQISRAAQLPTHDLTDLSTLRSWLNFPWGQSMEYEIYKATNTIRGYNQVGSLRPERLIPDAILRQAKGLAILTVMKVGVMVTYSVGTGLVIARREDGSWSPPSAVSSFGVGWGAQGGGEFTDYIIVLRSIDAVKTFSGDVHLSVGAGLSAAVGIVGRTAEADVRAGTGGYAACYTYSCCKGAFVGCSLEGSILTTRVKENSRFYGSQSITASDILLGSLPKPPAAATLYRALLDLYQKFKI